ncbi:MAG: hypothetical protein ACOC5L_01165 [Halobacteriota archaeon]
MNPASIGYEAVEIFELILPFLFLGFFIANLIKLSPYLKYIGKPMSYLNSASRLPARCSPALTMFFLNNWSGLGILSDFKQNKLLNDKEVFVAVLVGQFPKGMRTIIFFMGPVTLSVLGVFLGGILLSLELSIYLGIAVIGMIAGRLILNPESDINPGVGNNPNTFVFENSDKGWKEKLKEALIQSLREFKRIVIVLVPTVLVILILLDLGFQEFSIEVFKSILDIANLPSSSVTVLIASIASQMAAVSAVGTLIAKNIITPAQSLLLLFIARALHLGIGCFKTGLPINVALFGSSLGLKVTLAVYSLVELGIFLIVILLIYLM